MRCYAMVYVCYFASMALLLVVVVVVAWIYKPRIMAECYPPAVPEVRVVSGTYRKRALASALSSRNANIYERMCGDMSHTRRTEWHSWLAAEVISSCSIPAYLRSPQRLLSALISRSVYLRLISVNGFAPGVHWLHCKTTNRASVV